jgi:hypothetical protein
MRLIYTAPLSAGSRQSSYGNFRDLEHNIVIWTGPRYGWPEYVL